MQLPFLITDFQNARYIWMKHWKHFLPVKVRKGMKEEAALEYAGKFRYLSTDGTKPDNIEKKRNPSETDNSNL